MLEFLLLFLWLAFSLGLFFLVAIALYFIVGGDNDA